MSNKDEEKPKQRPRQLKWGDDEETRVLGEPSLNELRGFRMPGVELSGQEREGAAPAKFVQNSDATLEFDSESWVAGAPISEATGDARHHTPATLEVDVGESQLARLRAERKANLAEGDWERSQPTRKQRIPASPKSFMQKAFSRKTDGEKTVVQKSALPSAATGIPKISQALSPYDLRPDAGQPYRQWDLSATPLTAILLSLAASGETSVLDLQSGDNRAQLLISRGELLEIRLLPCSAKRSLSAGLVKQGRLNPAQAASVRQYAYEQGISEASALLKAGNLLPATTIRIAARARQRHLLERLMRANLAQASAYRLASLAAEHRVAPISLVGFLFERVRAHYDAGPEAALAKAEQRYIGMQIKLKANFAFSINHIGLPIHERQLLDRVLTRERDFDRVLHNSPTSRQASVAILAGLDAVGLLQVEGSGLSGQGSSSWAEDIALAGVRIDAMEMRLAHENYFDLFGLHWSTYDAEVERAYKALSTHFNLLKQPLGLDSSQRARLEVIRSELEKIHAILSDATRRAHYRRTLVSPANSRRTAQKLDGLGAAAFRKRAFHSALDYYQRLLELEPDNSKISRLLPVLLARTTSRR